MVAQFVFVSLQRFAVILYRGFHLAPVLGHRASYVRAHEPRTQKSRQCASDRAQQNKGVFKLVRHWSTSFTFASLTRYGLPEPFPSSCSATRIIGLQPKF